MFLLNHIIARSPCRKSLVLRVKFLDSKKWCIFVCFLASAHLLARCAIFLHTIAAFQVCPLLHHSVGNFWLTISLCIKHVAITTYPNRDSVWVLSVRFSTQLWGHDNRSGVLGDAAELYLVKITRSVIVPELHVLFRTPCYLVGKDVPHLWRYLCVHIILPFRKLPFCKQPGVLPRKLQDTQIGEWQWELSLYNFSLRLKSIRGWGWDRRVPAVCSASGSLVSPTGSHFLNFMALGWAPSFLYLLFIFCICISILSQIYFVHTQYIMMLYVHLRRERRREYEVLLIWLSLLGIWNWRFCEVIWFNHLNQKYLWALFLIHLFFSALLSKQLF